MSKNKKLWNYRPWEFIAKHINDHKMGANVNKAQVKKNNGLKNICRYNIHRDFH